uniref:Snake toxin/toxin-like domain-containing protein n=1 Tax=Nothoprocta perdicaria TaxID=30464 RepID=A0A8C7A373_NOTPE
MKAFLVVLLTLVLCAEQANTLWCYTCEWKHSNWKCLKAMKCSDKDEYCVTNVASVDVGMCYQHDRGSGRGSGGITKKCSATCPDHNFLLGLTSYTSTCCRTFLCNLSACAGPKCSIPLIILVALLWTLSRSSTSFLYWGAQN